MQHRDSLIISSKDILSASSVKRKSNCSITFVMPGPQLTISFDVTHPKENNRESQKILDERRDEFSCDCWEILRCLLKGQKLNSVNALKDGLSGHLPRRICDLREQGILVRDEWVEQNGRKHHHKDYFIDFNEAERVKNALIEGMRFQKRKTAA